MKFLLKLTLIAAAAWSGYWFIGAKGSRAGFEAWFEQQRNRGWTAEYSQFDLRGFPNRFDAGFSDLKLADPRSGVAWAAPFFQILALSYQPNHLIAVWPDKQVLTTPQDSYQITSEDIRASLKLEASIKLGLKKAVVTAAGLVVTPTRQQIEPTSADHITLAADHLADTRARYRLGLMASGIAPAPAMVALFDPERTLPRMISMVSADLNIGFDRPWDQKVTENSLPQPRHIEITRVEAKWGRLHLQMHGKLEIDPAGVATGEIRIKARHWRDIIALAVSSRAMSHAVAARVEEALGLLAQAEDDPEAVEISLGFDQGLVFLGPVSLGPAPVFRLNYRQ